MGLKGPAHYFVLHIRKCKWFIGTYNKYVYMYIHIIYIYIYIYIYIHTYIYIYIIVL